MPFRRALLLLAALCANVALAAAPPVLTPLPHLAGQKASAIGKSQAFPVRFNAQALHGMEIGAEAHLALPNGKRWPITFDRFERHEGGIASWVGQVSGLGKDYRVIVTTGPSGSFGSINTPDGEYRLVPGEGHDFLIDMLAEQEHLRILPQRNDGLMPPAHRMIPVPAVDETYTEAVVRETAEFGRPKTNSVIDLLIVYTNGFANKLGANLQTRLNFMVTRANQTYADSGIAITLRLVGSVMKNYSDTADECGSTSLNDITNGTGVFADVAALRNSLGADMVALQRSGDDFAGCGIAWIGGGGQGGTAGMAASANVMYSMTTGCTAGCEIVFIHELGHNMGSMHDRLTVISQGSGTLGFGVFSYSFGHGACTTLACDSNVTYCVNPRCSPINVNTDFGTVMSYLQPRVYKFSSNTLACGNSNLPCGIAVGQPNESHNVFSINQTAPVISAMKPTVFTGLPGTLQFSAAAYSVSEGNALLTVNVTRAGGTAGAASVAFATSDGTATAGTDYLAAAGTLNWADGDAGNKTFTVTILADAVTEGTESFNLALTGVTGAALGGPSTATVSILEPWPAGGTFPAGWATSAGANAGWAVAADSTFEGAASLKSGAIGNSQRADVEVTAATQAGTVSFARRVNSESNFDFLRFYLDGVLQGEWSGAIDWSVVSYPVAGAGVHTFRWSYQKDESVAGGLDAAWIDAVALPQLMQARADANADGKSDLFWRDASGGLSWWHMNANAIAQANYFFVGPEWQVRDVADLNGDGKADLVWRRSSDGAAYLWTLDGMTITGFADLGIVGLEWTLVGSADFNGDGKGDILWRRNDGTVYVWLMNGGAITGQAILGTIGNEWQIQDMADFDGDGKADILWRRGTDGTLYTWFMNGTVVSAQATVGALDPAVWTFAGAGDFNGDRRADILWRSSTGELYQWFMNWHVIQAQGSLGNPGLDWSVVTAAGDYNGDSRADILLRHTNGSMFLWMMNAGAIAASGPVSAPGGTWAVVAP
jgi:hypothetical protein